MAMACALSVVFLVAACVGSTVREVRPRVAVFLLPATAPGPDPFIDSTAATPSATRVSPSAQLADPTPAPPHSMRALSGATPGLYGGTAHVAGCDVERQISRLTTVRVKGDAFARTAGISRAALPGYLRGLTPVVLRVDTSVTNHAYRDGRASDFQSVLQAGTAVLVDDRGVPRVRCACGNPLAPPQPPPGAPGTRGTAWSGYRPTGVIVVTPAPQRVTAFTIIDGRTRTWIERRLGHDVRRDRVVPPPAPASRPPGGTEPPQATTPVQSPRPSPSPQATRPNDAQGETGRVPSGAAAGRSEGDCATLPAGGPVGCLPLEPSIAAPEALPDIPDGIGQPIVPEVLDPPDEGGRPPDEAPTSLDHMLDIPDDDPGG
ncbi:DUF6777 domain-containing protein [Streptomyces sp. NPDC101151]|uniref:DUF6777 domain-containing protein n=1 Tax=Streptomyces sp. NPDC101151 TaxID=3366115 RepID=UPI00381B3713